MWKKLIEDYTMAMALLQRSLRTEADWFGISDQTLIRYWSGSPALLIQDQPQPLLIHTFNICWTWSCVDPLASSQSSCCCCILWCLKYFLTYALVGIVSRRRGSLKMDAKGQKNEAPYGSLLPPSCFWYSVDPFSRFRPRPLHTSYSSLALSCHQD